MYTISTYTDYQFLQRALKLDTLLFIQMNLKGKVIHVFSKQSIKEIISSDIFKNLVPLHSNISIDPQDHTLINDNSLIIIRKSRSIDNDIVKLREHLSHSTILLCSQLNILPACTQKIIDITVFYLFDPIFANPLICHRLAYFVPEHILCDYISKIDSDTALHGYDGCRLIKI